MRLLTELVSRIRSLLFARREALEIDEELQFHIEKETEKNLAAGMNPREARRQAHMKLGGMERVRERTREAQGVALVEDLVRDLELATRSLKRTPLFTIAAILTLAVAIGANTAIFTVVEGVLLRPLPYPDADRVVTVANGRRPAPGRTGTLSFSDRGYWHFVNNNRVFDEFGGYSSGTSTLALTGDGQPLPVDVGMMTTSAFETLGVLPERGRFPTAEEAGLGPGASPVVLLSHALWMTRYGSDPSIIGRNIELDGFSWQVIGVMPEGFNFPTPETDLWMPRRLDPASANFGQHGISAIARLAPGSTIADAVEDAEGLIARYDEAGYPPSWFTDVFSGTAVIRTLQDELVGDVRQPLIILLGTVGFVLLIACTNVANLLLVRTDARAQENAVRMALGSGRSRQVRFVLTEGILLAAMGGAAGTLLAYLGTSALLWVAPESIPRLDAIGLRSSVLLFAGGLSFLAGFLFSVLPALRSGSEVALGALSNGGRGVTIHRDRYRAQSALIVVQVALALVVVVGSGLMVRSFLNLRAVDLGFVAEGLLTFRARPPVTLEYQTPEARAQFYDRLVERLEDIPGVVSAAGVSALPLSGANFTAIVRVQEFPPADDEMGLSFLIRRATPGYFETMGIPVVEGRSFTADDHRARLGSLIISRSVKDQYWPDVSALGRRFGIDAPVTSVGVVGDVHALGLHSPAEPHLYFAIVDSALGGVGPMTMVVRSDAGPLDLIPAIQSAIEEIHPDQTMTEISTMDDVVAESMSRTSFTMTLLLLAAAISVLLASVGIYGVISYVVSHRIPELGVRMALGANGFDVRWQVLRTGMTPAVIGIAIGLGSAAIMSRMLTPLLFGTDPLDPLTFALGLALFVGVAGLACLVPAQKATRIDPATVLRGD